MVMARAGRWRHRITVQTATETADAHGQRIKTWADEDTARWGSIEPINGDEKFNAQRVEAGITHKIEMRYAPLNSSQRLYAKGKTFNIVNVLDLFEKQRYTVALCKEVETELLPVTNDEGATVYNDAGSQVYVAR